MPSQTRPDNYCKRSRRAFLFLAGATLVQGLPMALSTALPASANQPVKVIRRTVDGVPFYQTTIDLTDPKTFVTIGLANNATQANSSKVSAGAESFKGIVRRSRAAVVASGTFFSVDAQKRVMGNMVAGGKFLKYSPWENYGTTLGLRIGNQPEMITARIDGKPPWQDHWFSLTGGPRLLKAGKVSLQPRKEGFADPNVLGVAYRSAIGYPRGGKKLVIATFLTPLSLAREARLMKAIGCYEAMNLDGGSSIALAKGNKILVPTSRGLTNAIVVYDAKHPAPKKLQETWTHFQQGKPTLPYAIEDTPEHLTQEHLTPELDAGHGLSLQAQLGDFEQPLLDLEVE
ncbi:MAG: phosphodiester glycosidase family protein [Leptolyngbyaceae bacterium]|nr:phosphodiester glycosidase family protein [Leptolyngbyaceae bacterium]